MKTSETHEIVQMTGEDMEHIFDICSDLVNSFNGLVDVARKIKAEIRRLKGNPSAPLIGAAMTTDECLETLKSYIDKMEDVKKQVDAQIAAVQGCSCGDSNCDSCMNKKEKMAEQLLDDLINEGQGRKETVKAKPMNNIGGPETMKFH